MNSFSPRSWWLSGCIAASLPGMLEHSFWAHKPKGISHHLHHEFSGLAVFVALRLSALSKSSLPSSKDKKIKTCERQEGERYPNLLLRPHCCCLENQQQNCPGVLWKWDKGQNLYTVIPLLERISFLLHVLP